MHLLWISVICFSCVFVCYAVLSVPCSLVITYCERANLLALLCVMCSCALSLSHIVSRCPRSGVVFVSILQLASFFTSRTLVELRGSSKEADVVFY